MQADLNADGEILGNEVRGHFAAGMTAHAVGDQKKPRLRLDEEGVLILLAA
jgi:hypothetical protein